MSHRSIERYEDAFAELHMLGVIAISLPVLSVLRRVCAATQHEDIIL